MPTLPQGNGPFSWRTVDQIVPFGYGLLPALHSRGSMNEYDSVQNVDDRITGMHPAAQRENPSWIYSPTYQALLTSARDDGRFMRGELAGEPYKILRPGLGRHWLFNVLDALAHQEAKERVSAGNDRQPGFHRFWYSGSKRSEHPCQ